MIKRDDVIIHVTSQGCAVREAGHFEDGDFYINLINNREAWIVNEPELDVIMCCDIFCDLGIPALEGYEEDLDKFLQFKVELANMHIPES